MREIYEFTLALLYKRRYSVLLFSVLTFQFQITLNM